MHKGQYLSIGEMAKLSRVNIKSLRYYDRIGVLKPAFTDEETGYRYYLPAQLGILEAIRFCIDVGIPLKEFSDYTTEGSINTELLLRNAASTAMAKMQSIRNGLYFIENLQALIQRNERLLAAQGPITYTMEPLCCLVEPLSAQFDLIEFSGALSRLQVEAIEHGCRVGYDYGQLMLWRDDRSAPEHYVYTAVTGGGETLQNILRFPAAEYSAIYVRENSISDAPALFPACFSQPGVRAAVQTEVISRVFDTNRHGYELRCTVLPR